VQKCIKFLEKECVHASNFQDFDAYMQVSVTLLTLPEIG